MSGAPYTVTDDLGSAVYGSLEDALDGLVLRGLEPLRAMTVCSALMLATEPMTAVFDWLILLGQDAAQALSIVGGCLRVPVSAGSDTP